MDELQEGGAIPRRISRQFVSRLIVVGLVGVFRFVPQLCAPALAQQAAEVQHVQGGPQDSLAWRFASADVNYRIDDHRQATGEGRSGRPCESITITAGQGSYLHISHAIDRSRVVGELEIKLWLKATRPGLQIVARVVLPGAIDASTGKPLFTLVRGPSYKQAGVWEEMRINGFPQLVERQLRMLRAQHGPQIDARGAYVDFVGLNIYGGQGQTKVWIDEVSIGGAVPTGAVAPHSMAQAVRGGTPSPTPSGQRVRLSGSILNVDGRPLFPRVIEHQGEPLSFLAEMGFNAIRTAGPPSDDLLAEAEQSGLWIVAPPPPLAPERSSSQQEISAKYDRVLVWTLGQDLTSRDFERVAALAQDIKRADRRQSRPLLCAPETELLRYSREVRDLLSVYRFPLATSLELADYGTWLRERSRLARAGTPFWTVIQTQPAAATRRQWTAFHPNVVAGGVDVDALRLLVYTAIGAGVRGLEFASHSPLDAQDSQTRMRALTLAALNAEMGLLEPWAAAGNYVTTADSNDPHVKGMLLQYESSRLLVVTRVAPHAQFVPQYAKTGGVSFVLPGLPESHELVELTAGGLRPLKHKRVTGGTLIALDDFDLTALVLITPDAVLTNALSRRLAGVAKRAAELERELAARTMAEVEAVERRLPTEVRDPATAAALLTAARRSLDEADKALAAGDRRIAYIAARRASSPLGQLKRTMWDRAYGSLRSSVASPALASFTTLGEHWRLIAALRTATADTNRLPAGDFENLQAMVDSGWRHVVHSLRGVETTVEFSPGGTSGGRSCLRMEVRPKEPAGADVLVETAPVWVTTPAAQVRQGEIVRIKGRVRVPTPVRGSVDGLMVVDSLGGDGLAERFGQTSGWEEFVMYRAAPSDGEITVTFALTGFGEAMIDDVEIRAMRLAPGILASPTRASAPGIAEGVTGASRAAAAESSVKQARRGGQIFAPPRR